MRSYRLFKTLVPAGRSAAILIFFRRKQSVSYDLFCDGWPALYGHWHPACVYENHERFCGGGDEAEMYVS